MPDKAGTKEKEIQIEDRRRCDDPLLILCRDRLTFVGAAEQ